MRRRLYTSQWNTPTKAKIVLSGALGALRNLGLYKACEIRKAGDSEASFSVSHKNTLTALGHKRRRQPCGAAPVLCLLLLMPMQLRNFLRDRFFELLYLETIH